MIGLEDIFIVLEYNFDEGSVVSPQHGCIEAHSGTIGNLRDAPNTKNSGYVEVVGEFQRRVRSNERDTVKGVSLLAIELSS